MRSSLITLLALAYRYIFTFAIGAGPVTGLIIPELSSAKMRGKIMGFSFSVHWVGTQIIFHNLFPRERKRQVLPSLLMFRSNI
jgi:hypothetical protein